MSNLFDKAMPHRNDPETPKPEVKCRFCGTWHTKGRLARHVEAHKRKEQDGPPAGGNDGDSSEGEA